MTQEQEVVDTDNMHDDPEWSTFWNEGIRYREVVNRAWPARKTFTPEILYHMSGMALEKLFMGWLGLEGRLPDNHTVRDLARAAQAVEPLPEDLYKELRRFDRFMGLCSLEPVPIPPPASADVPGFLEAMDHALEWLLPRYEKALAARAARRKAN